MCNIVEYVTLYFANLFHLIRIYTKIFRFTMFVNIMLLVKLAIRNVNIVG